MAAAVFCLAASSSEAVTYTYDDNGRLTLVTPQDGNGMEYSYDPVGNRLATNSQAASLSGLTVSPATYNFGNAFIDMISAAQAFTISNPGALSVKIDSVSVSRGKTEFFLQSDQCSGVTLSPQGSCSFEVYIRPLSIGAKTAWLSVISDDGVSPLLSMPLSGTGIYAPIISTSPTSLSFRQLVGSQTVRPITVSNVGMGDLLINGISLTENVNFSIAYDSCTGSTLGSGASCRIDVEFIPQSTGYKSGFLNIVSNAPDSPFAVSISGLGDIPSPVDPESYNFGIRDVNNQYYVYKTFTVSNIGQSPFSVTGAGLSEYTNYGIYSNGCGYYDRWLHYWHHITLDPGEWCGVTVRFKPMSTGVKNATLSLTTSDWTSPTKTVALTGTGSTLRYRRLSVNINGDNHYFMGSGTVTSSPPGIDCSTDCWADYLYGTVVTLTAQPSAGSFFAGWDNISCNDASPVCTFTVNHDINPIVQFYTPPQSSSSVTQLDLAIAVDTSGSMWNSMDKVKTNLRKVVESVGSTMSDYRIALVDYRDFMSQPYKTGDYPYHVVLPFTSDMAAVLDAIDGLTLGGGGDLSEAVDSSLIKTIAAEGTGGWRAGVRKAIILVGDAPPHSHEFTGYDLSYVFENAQATEPVTIYSASMGGDMSAKDYFSLVSELSGGWAFELSNPDGIVSDLLGLPYESADGGYSDCDAAYATTSQLWPVDHGMQSVDILNVYGPDGYPADITIKSITQDEPVVDSGNFVPDGFGIGTDTAVLRAERDGTGNGRVYKIIFSALGSYGQCEGSVLVCAPHDQGDNEMCVDDGQQYDSTQQ